MACFDEASKRIDVIVLASILERAGRIHLVWAWLLVGWTLNFGDGSRYLEEYLWGPVPLTREIRSFIWNGSLDRLEFKVFSYLFLALLACLIWYAFRRDWTGFWQTALALVIWVVLLDRQLAPW